MAKMNYGKRFSGGYVDTGAMASWWAQTKRAALRGKTMTRREIFADPEHGLKAQRDTLAAIKNERATHGAVGTPIRPGIPKRTGKYKRHAVYINGVLISEKITW